MRGLIGEVPANFIRKAFLHFKLLHKLLGTQVLQLRGFVVASFFHRSGVALGVPDIERVEPFDHRAAWLA
jgi:hypothetical protein